MTEKTINCENCSVEFTFEENPKYPRKYCLNCSAKKKKQYAEKDTVSKTVDEFGAPVERIMEKLTDDKKPSKPTNGKEYHLSPEQVRSNALSCAIEVGKKGNEFEDMTLLDLAKQFEKWINGN